MKNDSLVFNRFSIIPFISFIPMNPFWFNRYTVPSHALKNPGRAHPAADTHGDHAITGLPALHLVHQGRCQFGAGATKGMPKSNCATVDVDDLRIKSQLLDDRKRLCGKGFIEFNQVEVFLL